MTPTEYFEAKLETLCKDSGKKKDQGSVVLSIYRRWKANGTGTLVEACSDIEFFNKKTFVQSTVGYLDKLKRIEKCEGFVPSGYPIVDRCKICGVYVYTQGGLNTLAQEAYLAGKVDGILYDRYIAERCLSEAHGIIQSHQFSTQKLEVAISKKKNEVSIEENTSDTSVDMNLSLGEVKRNNNKKKEEKVEEQHSLKSPELLEVGAVVHYSPEKSKKVADRKVGIILERRVLNKKYTFRIQAKSNKKQQNWVSPSYIWTSEPLSDEDNSNKQGFLSDTEKLVVYPGFHY